MQPYVDSSATYNSQDLETAQLPVSRWVDKNAVRHLPNGILHNHKKKDLLPFVKAWVDLEVIIHL